QVRRLTHSGWVAGIVRGAPDGKRIAYLSHDQNGTPQATLIDSDGSDRHEDLAKHPKVVTALDSGASDLRWHPDGNWLFCLSGGNIVAVYVGEGDCFGKMLWLSHDKMNRAELVVSPDGNQLAYVSRPELRDEKGKDLKDVSGKYFRQIYVMTMDIEKMRNAI
ncbi:MAG: hypothetical protein E4H13_15100, partial [Calditrichales bacterium]